jgi:hypothetical protein
MGIILWKWKFVIAPALISENLGIKNGKKQIKKSWGSFETRKIYTGIRLPLAGDVVNIPDYGPCKVERVKYVNGVRSRAWIVSIVISPKSLGNTNWWLENRNHPIHKHQQNWKLSFSFIKEDYNDLELADEYILEED